jgi:hypothetical protein
MPRFVILEHTGSPTYKPGVHWDLLLEQGEVLKAWELLQPLESVLEQEIRTLPDHRLHYLDYEGPISGDRGSVKRWDAGDYQLIDSSDNVSVYRLAGKRIVGEVRITGSENGASNMLLCYTPEN